MNPEQVGYLAEAELKPLLPTEQVKGYINQTSGTGQDSSPTIFHQQEQAIFAPLQPHHKTPKHFDTMFKSAVIALFALASVASASPIATTNELEKKDSEWGVGTWYTQNGNPGNCGWYKS